MRKVMIAANWKMHLNVQQASLLVHRLNERIKVHRDIEVVLAPSMLCLQPLSLDIDRRKFRLAAQDAYYKDDGPYTGEVSFTMIRDIVHYSIIGHSGRRIYFHETLEETRDKVEAAVRNEITPILCVGETKEERKDGMTKQVLHDQIVTALYKLTAEEVAEMVIAYEPVWAISTFDGEVAKPHDVQDAFKFVRFQVAELYGEKTAKAIRVLYGGSVDDHDARAYLEVPGCDGVLVGAASLNYMQFSGIVDSAYRMLHELGDAED
ncbi:MAG TPA: triose-phosphate isomerase [Candidatus Saccharimonadales bacterium]|nr:triose-phosphate isomerase [Candidatus Saccharimonadales bacterium]